VAAALATGAVWLSLAAALHRRNAAWESAEALFTDAVEQAPARPHARLGLGRALVARGDLEGAIHQYRDALSWLDPGEPGDEGPLQEALGEVLVEAGRPAEALEPLRRAAALEPRRASAPAALAEAALLAGRTDEAERAALRALALEPGNARAARVRSRLAAEPVGAAPQGPDGDPQAPRQP
jgi:tetratricopeptide (TPR) repeat protein